MRKRGALVSQLFSEDEYAAAEKHSYYVREPAHDDEEGGKSKEKVAAKPTSVWDNHVVKCE